ncbi:MAG TPA: hypothetical protein VGH50_17950 [Candidatus Binatia bacterium]|jgi:hypothetical protein
MMKLLGVLMVSLFLASAAAAAGPKDYQVTGPVLDVNNDVITVQKGSEKWEIGRDKSTKIDGDLKKGSKVTIHYTMTATKVEVKEAAKSKTDAKSSEKKTK